MANLMDVYKRLPGTNCKKCGEDSCMVFASKLMQGKAKIESCEPLIESEFKEKRLELDIF